MMDWIRTLPSRLMSGLAIAGSLVCMAGCAPFAASPISAPQPTMGPVQPDALSGIEVEAGEPVTGIATTGVPANSDEIQPAATRLVSDPDPTISDRYIARQFPNNGNYSTPPSLNPATSAPPATAPGYNFTPPPGPPLPPGSDLTPPPTAIYPGGIDPYAPLAPQMQNVGPRVREADLIINGFPARTGRIIFGGAVNSDAGVTGQITVDERNFDIARWPRSFADLFSGTAFRGAGQTFRLEAAPGSAFDRYTLQFADPNLFGYKPVSLSVSGFLYDRRFNDWDENRLGGRVALGYRVTPDLSVSLGMGGQNVDITPTVSATTLASVPELSDVAGNNGLYSGEVSLIHDTRNSPIQASRGHYFQFKFEEVFGTYDYARFELEYRRYWLIAERADSSGKQTISYSTRVGFSGDETPIFENFFAGGYATIRGFDFRGASPVVNGVEVGGQFQWLNTVEYMFPITADDAFRGVAFVDFGTVEQTVTITEQNYRVAPGLGLRVAIPMLGPAPLAFDFAYPVAKADTDQTRVFSFYMSLIR